MKSEYEGELEIEQRAHIEKQLERAEDLQNAFSALFATPNGELVLGYLAAEYRVHAPLIAAGEELNGLSMALREGARLVVLDIIQRASDLSTELRVPKGDGK